MTAQALASVDVAARDGRGRCRIEQTRLLDGCVGTYRCTCCRRGKPGRVCKRRQEACLQAVAGKLLQRSHVAQESLAFVDAAGASVDIHTLSCTPLIQPSSNLSVPNHSWYARNSFPTTPRPVPRAANTGGGEQQSLHCTSNRNEGNTAPFPCASPAHIPRSSTACFF